MFDFESRVNNLVENIIKQQNDYLEECAEYRERGHRHRFCFHGVNQWVDYDCACWACEDGEINEYSSEEEIRKYAEAECA